MPDAFVFSGDKVFPAFLTLTNRPSSGSTTGGLPPYEQVLFIAESKVMRYADAGRATRAAIAEDLVRRFKLIGKAQ